MFEKRWQQRFENFQKAFLQFENAINKENLSQLERSGLLQTFEFTFELSWKTLKDFLYAEGITANTPREVIQKSFHAEIIQDGHDWIDALEKRNLLSHSYSEELSKSAEKLIREKYYNMISKFKLSFEKKFS